VSPRDIGLIAEGPFLESTPIRVNADSLEQLWQTYPILVLPGYYGMDAGGRTTLFGRGGSDLSALFVAAELGGGCHLLKDVPGVFDDRPARNTVAHRYSALSWATAINLAGPLIQPKALRYAHSRALTFEVGRPNGDGATTVGQSQDQWSPPTRPSRPLRIALFGCGVVGRGVCETLKRYPEVFEIRHVVVREVERYPDVEHLSTDPSVIFDDSTDVVIVCFGGITMAYPLIAAALSARKFVITANKAALAAHGKSLLSYARGEQRRLWYSAAVGGALPAIETLSSLQSPVRELRAIINGTCGVVLDAWAAGKTQHEAVLMAQARGLTEADPVRDLSGRDSADKLALMAEAAFGHWMEPEDIPTRGIDTITDNPAGYKLVARATNTLQGITASVAPELPPPDSFLGQSRGPENRLEIELTTGEIIRLRGQGAGRWATTVSVLGDLHEIARRLETQSH
jgi:homoserine dehydrogenase